MYDLVEGNQHNQQQEYLKHKVIRILKIWDSMGILLLLFVMFYMCHVINPRSPLCTNYNIVLLKQTKIEND